MSSKLDRLLELAGQVRAYVSEGGRGDSFDSLARALFEFQFEHNAVYQAYCRSLGKTPATVAAHREMPPMITSAFKEAELTVLSESERERVFHSSGTTEMKPSRHFHNAITLGVYETSLLAWFEPWFLPDGARLRCLSLTPDGARAPSSSLVHMFETVSERFGTRDSLFAGRIAGDGGWTLDFERTREALESACARGLPLAIFGAAFSFVHLLDHLEERGLKVALPPGSRILETGGYKGRSRVVEKGELHRALGEKLGLPAEAIVTEYGMSELSSQAYDARYAGGGGERSFQFPPWARAAVISPETGREAREGEAGLLRVYDLANIGSVMAVQTEDVVVARGGGFQLLGRAGTAEARGCSLMLSN